MRDRTGSTRTTEWRACVAVGLLALPIPAAARNQQKPLHRGASLGICNEAKTGRPRIDGLDVCVWNLGDSEGHGVLFVELLDSAGVVIQRFDVDAGRRVVRVPPYHEGGKQGTLTRINPPRDFLALATDLERQARRYGVRATIETSGRDADLSDNAKVKEFGTNSNIMPGEARELYYAFRNDSAFARQVRWVMHRLVRPIDWSMEGAPNESAIITWNPGEELRGALTLRAPPRLPNGSFAEIRLTLVDASSRKVLHQREWFLTFDRIPPVIANVRAILMADHLVAVQALAGDEHSGLHEQHGLLLHHSADSGRTWMTEAPRNRVGHFIEPTVFEFTAGPFTPGVRLLIRLEARDRAGNTTSLSPEDASVFVAPANADRLAVKERSLAQPEKSQLFEVERLQRLHGALTRQRAALTATELTATRAVAGRGTSENRSARRPLLTRRIEDLQTELDKLSALGIDVSAFKRVETAGVKSVGRGWTTLSVTIP